MSVFVDGIEDIAVDSTGHYFYLANGKNDLTYIYELKTLTVKGVIEGPKLYNRI
jgi:hypothetical protein